MKKNNFEKNEQNQSCSKLAEMARKFVGNNFRTFWTPPIQKKNKLPPFDSTRRNIQKNQSYSKLAEMARKLVG